jgi:hypothetical protein
VYEHIATGTVDIGCIKNLDKDFIYMFVLVTLMTVGVFLYALL